MEIEAWSLEESDLTVFVRIRWLWATSNTLTDLKSIYVNLSELVAISQASTTV